MPIITNAPQVQAENNSLLQNAGGSLGGLFNPGVQAQAQFRRAETQKALGALLEQQLKTKALQDYQQRVASGGMKDPNQRNQIMADLGVMRGGSGLEDMMKGGALMENPGAPLAAALPPIKLTPGETVNTVPGDPRFPGSQGGPAPLGGASAPGGGKLPGAADLKKMESGRTTLSLIQQAEQNIQNNPGALGGPSHILPQVIASALPRGFGGQNDADQQQVDNLGDLFSQITLARAGMRGSSSPNAIALDRTFLPKPTGGILPGNWPDTDQTAMNKLKSYEQGVRTEAQNQAQTLQQNGYQANVSLPPPLPGISMALPQVGAASAGAPTITPIGTSPSSGTLTPAPATPAETNAAPTPASGAVLPPISQRQVGMPHPQNPNYVWSQDGGGNYGWAPVASPSNGNPPSQ